MKAMKRTRMSSWWFLINSRSVMLNKNYDAWHQRHTLETLKPISFTHTKTPSILTKTKASCGWGSRIHPHRVWFSLYDEPHSQQYELQVPLSSPHAHGRCCLWCSWDEVEGRWKFDCVDDFTYLVFHIKIVFGKGNVPSCEVASL